MATRGNFGQTVADKKKIKKIIIIIKGNVKKGRKERSKKDRMREKGKEKEWRAAEDDDKSLKKIRSSSVLLDNYCCFIAT